MAGNYTNIFYNDYQSIVEKLAILTNEFKEYKESSSNKIILLEEENKNLGIENEKLKKEVNRLKSQINKDSSNSSKPSSTNGFKKIFNSRETSNNPVGAPKGHIGHTAKLQTENITPVDIKKEVCECGGKVKNDEKYIAKQLVDIEVIVRTVEYRGYNGTCQKCGKLHKPTFPVGINNPIQYGPTLKTVCSGLNTKNIVSLDNTVEFIEFITNNSINLSKTTPYNFAKELSVKLSPVMDNIKEKLMNSKYVNADESPINIDGETYYLHNISNENYTFQEVQKTRGIDAVEKIALLTCYLGIIISDHFLMYYNYGIDNGECNAHILRYLKGVTENTKHPWAEQFRKFLLKAKEERQNLIDKGGKEFSKQQLNNYISEYRKILSEGKRQWLEDHNDYVASQDERRLLARLTEYEHNHLLFAKDFDIPFTNNMAERDIRPYKVKQKVGIFRNVIGADTYAINKSCISTYSKNNIDVFEAIKSAFKNNPVKIN